MYRYTLMTVLFLLITGTLVRVGYAQPADSLRKSFLQFKTQLDSAVVYGDKEQLIRARDGIQEFTGRSDFKKLAAYYIGYADYRLSSIFEDISDDQKEEYLDAAIQQLEQLTEMAPEFAEAWALLGNCYGMKATGIISGMRYGPKSDSAIKEAISLAPENPRVVMFNGIALMYKPALFGGSVEKAINEFKEAGTFFEQWNTPGELHPDWGHAENYAWMAQAYEQQDQLQQARRAYRQALEVNPDYYWVKQILLPELEQQIN